MNKFAWIACVALVALVALHVPGAHAATGATAVSGGIVNGGLGEGTLGLIQSQAESLKGVAEAVDAFAQTSQKQQQQQKKKSSSNATQAAAEEEGNLQQLVDLSQLRTGGPGGQGQTAAQRSASLGLTTATLSMVGSSISLASSLISETSAALGLLSTVLGLPIKYYKLETSQTKVGISSYSFAQTLYNDLNSQIKDSDVLGDAAKYIKLWNQIQQGLRDGSLQADVSDQIQQLQTASDITAAISNSYRPGSGSGGGSRK